ncbi:MAG: phosphoglycerate kinase [Saprospiraceae bacterium]|nr:phosphoglycerate kinase [Saprospiraceae bacterium]
MNQLSIAGKKVLVRVDFNVPMNAQHEITDDTRIRGALPTVAYILAHGGSPILMSHLGRPLKQRLADGSIDTSRFTLRHLVDHLSALTGVPVHFATDCIGPAAEKAAAQLPSGEILLLENTRFHEGEEKGDPAMAAALASLGDLYVNDAFGTAHRAHASTALIASHFAPDHRAFGFLMDAELTNAYRTMDHPERPLVAIVGGAKVSDKILLLDHLLDKVDGLIIGGGMAYTFIAAQGGEIGNSLVESDRLELARQLLAKAKRRHVQLLLPSDSVIADAFAADAQTQVVPSGEIPTGWMGLDIGPEARAAFSGLIMEAKTILWNGPMGVFEMPAFAKGTLQVATALADATAHGAFSLVGGGDSVTAVNQMGLADQVSFVSTGGGAMLELLEGKVLPGVAAIKG